MYLVLLRETLGADWLTAELFRFGASSLANDAPDALQSARSLLGHRHASTTERYYIHADQRAASRRINNLIDGLKAECRTGGWRGD